MDLIRKPDVDALIDATNWTNKDDCTACTDVVFSDRKTRVETWTFPTPRLAQEFIIRCFDHETMTDTDWEDDRGYQHFKKTTKYFYALAESLGGVPHDYADLYEQEYKN